MFEWDEGNVEHIARHNVLPREAEEAMADPKAITGEAYSTEDEWRDAIVGMTLAGKLLFVVYTERGMTFRVLHARNASWGQRREYERWL